jgi:hypothetical protein
MNAFPRSLAAEERFTAPLYEDDSDVANVETQEAVARFQEVWGSIEAMVSRFDGWASDHDRRADYGEARVDAPTQIDAITARLQIVEMNLNLLWVAAQKVSA